MLETARENRALWLRLLVVLVAMTSVGLAQSPEEHAKHHPKKAGEGEKGKEEKPGGMMGEGMAGMMDGMMEKMGAPKPKDLYPSLMNLPDLPQEKRDEIKLLAHQRMKDGAAIMSEAMGKLSLQAPSDDFASMQTSTAQLKEGLAQFESGLAAHRALEEGKAPRNVALHWFKKEMNLLPAGQTSQTGGVFGLSWSHFTVMLLLIGFFVTMIWMYFFKMRRASELLQSLSKATSKDLADPPVAPERASPEARPALTPAPATAVQASAPNAGKWRGQLSVSRIFEETPNVKTFRLVSPDGGALPFTYLPGQFLTLSVPEAGKTVKRSYTIASSPTQQHYCEITVKREDQGVASRHLHDEVSEGTLLEVSAPSGKFTFNGEAGDSIVLVGGGVGITPMMSVIRYLTDISWGGQIHLLYCCRTTTDFIFREELENLQRRHSNLQVVATMTRADGTVWMGMKGRFTKEILFESVPDLARKRIHICGPPPMMDAIISMLETLEVPKENIKTEAFGPAKRPAKPPAAEAESDAPKAEVATVTFKQSGKSAPLPADSTVLDVADELDIEIENSCRTGSCGSCKVKLLSGTVTMECEDGLDPGEKDDGIILACQAQSAGDVEVDV